MTSKHGENDRYWRVIGVQRLVWKYYKSHRKPVITHKSINLRSPRDALSREKLSLTLACKLFHSLYPLGLTYRNREHKLVYGYTLHSLHHRIRAILQPEGRHTTCQSHCRNIVSLVTCPWINPYADQIRIRNRLFSECTGNILIIWSHTTMQNNDEGPITK